MKMRWRTHWSPLDGDCEILFSFVLFFFTELWSCSYFVFLPLWEEAIAFFEEIFSRIFVRLPILYSFYLLIEVLKDLRQVQRMPYSLPRRRQLFRIKDSIRHKRDNKANPVLNVRTFSARQTKTPKNLEDLRHIFSNLFSEMYKALYPCPHTLAEYQLAVTFFTSVIDHLVTAGPLCRVHTVITRNLNTSVIPTTQSFWFNMFKHRRLVC